MRPQTSRSWGKRQIPCNLLSNSVYLEISTVRSREKACKRGARVGDGSGTGRGPPLGSQLPRPQLRSLWAGRPMRRAWPQGQGAGLATSPRARGHAPPQPALRLRQATRLQCHHLGDQDAAATAACPATNQQASWPPPLGTDPPGPDLAKVGLGSAGPSSFGLELGVLLLHPQSAELPPHCLSPGARQGARVRGDGQARWWPGRRGRPGRGGRAAAAWPGWGQKWPWRHVSRPLDPPGTLPLPAQERRSEAQAGSPRGLPSWGRHPSASRATPGRPSQRPHPHQGPEAAPGVARCPWGAADSRRRSPLCAWPPATAVLAMQLDAWGHTSGATLVWGVLWEEARACVSALRVCPCVRALSRRREGRGAGEEVTER